MLERISEDLELTGTELTRFIEVLGLSSGCQMKPAGDDCWWGFRNIRYFFVFFPDFVSSFVCGAISMTCGFLQTISYVKLTAAV